MLIKRPYAALRINWGETLKNGLVSFFSGPSGADLVNSTPYTLTSVTSANSIVGIAASFDGTNTQASRLVAAPAQWTTACLVMFDSVPSGANAFNDIATFFQSTDSEPVSTYDKSLGLYYSSGAKLVAHTFDGASKNVTGATTIQTGTLYLLGASADGTNLRVWVNGIQDGSVASGNTYTGYASPAFGLARKTPGWGFLESAHTRFAGKLFWAGLWNRALTQQEWLRLAADPNVLFVRPKAWTYAVASGDVTVALTGIGMTASAGTLTPSNSVAMTGLASTASQGSVAPVLTVPITGQSITFSQGSMSPSLSVALSGSAVTTATGTLTPTTGLVIELTGQSASFSQGSMRVSSSVSLTGQSHTASQGSLTPAMSLAISGQAVTFSQGTIRPGISIALSGQAATTAQGAITASGGNTPSVWTSVDPTSSTWTTVTTTSTTWS